MHAAAPVYSSLPMFFLSDCRWDRSFPRPLARALGPALGVMEASGMLGSS